MKEPSELASKLSAVAPKLKINVRTEESADDYDKAQAKSLKAQIKALEDEDKNWNAEGVAAQARKKLKAEIAKRKAALMEID